MPRARVPEAAIHEDSQPELGKDEVGTDGELKVESRQEGGGRAGFRLSTPPLSTSAASATPSLPCARNTRTSAGSVAAFPRDRMRAMTADRLALVKRQAQGQVNHKDTKLTKSFSSLCPS